MPNLFPTVVVKAKPDSAEMQAGPVKFGKSWRYDFNSGEFILTPTGKVAQSGGTDAWLEWCRKALVTARYRFLAYSRNYGQEFADLISRHLTRAGNESEIKRIATQCLMVDPRTASVDSFTFNWEGESCYFTCRLSNVRGEAGIITGSVVLN